LISRATFDRVQELLTLKAHAGDRKRTYDHYRLYAMNAGGVR
jgi:hypothetical protein